MIPDIRQSFSRECKNRPIPCTTNPVGMKICAETTTRWFSDRLSVPVLSPYAYQDAIPLVPAYTGGTGGNFLILSGGSIVVGRARRALKPRP